MAVPVGYAIVAMAAPGYGGPSPPQTDESTWVGSWLDTKKLYPTANSHPSKY